MLTFDSIRDIAGTLPGVSESTLHGKPSIKVKGKLMACVPVHSSAESGCAAVRIDFAQRAGLLRKSPKTYYVTDHYIRYPIVLVRLALIEKDELEILLQRSWEIVAGKVASSRSKERSKRPTLPSRKTPRERRVSRKS